MFNSFSDTVVLIKRSLFTSDVDIFVRSRLIVDIILIFVSFLLSILTKVEDSRFHEIRVIDHHGVTVLV